VVLNHYMYVYIIYPLLDLIYRTSVPFLNSCNPCHFMAPCVMVGLPKSIQILMTPWAIRLNDAVQDHCFCIKHKCVCAMRSFNTSSDNHRNQDMSRLGHCRQHWIICLRFWALPKVNRLHGVLHLTSCSIGCRSTHPIYEPVGGLLVFKAYWGTI